MVRCSKCKTKYFKYQLNAVEVFDLNGKLKKWYCGTCAAMKRPKDPKRAYNRIENFKSNWIGKL